ncbi:hypothetical protein PHYSODRAFT_500360 [Phytophthora sojae]|uniref:Uncharacterized protein n=1 Tax=Phytophthora sojae (strain P6497) TaxID=1094619 RepID=G4ZGL0_PHYSP|nr:hypothetical protein PHYSODRAFT_500360 [Phytophthora sojae]EGZ17092.1 hypothetical protein PHYSODRAFT_500360 [Phytophthora sojae]|eukprot:XP_009526150.1 hypothetical protein PHYSODRAFT_500360 [Phytophthora sojae]
MLDGASVVNGFLEKILRKCSQELRGVNRSQVNIYDPRVPEEDKKPLRLATPLDGLGVKLEEALIVQVELNAPIFVNQIYLHGLSTDSPHLEREELMERVYTSLWTDNNRFVLLSAPSASGKSSLLILYAHRYTHLNCMYVPLSRGGLSVNTKLRLEGLDIFEQESSLSEDQQHVMPVDGAEELFDDKEFWNILITEAPSWLPDNVRFIISAGTTQRSGVESPEEFQTIVTFERRDFLLSDEEARKFLDFPGMGLPDRFKKEQFVDFLVREACWAC